MTPINAAELGERNGFGRPGAGWLTTAGQFPLRVGVALAALFALLVRTRPQTFWEYDELLFGAGVVSFEPLRHHPHPPGYPVYIGFGKIVNLAVGDAFTALVVLSIVMSLAGFVFLAAACRNLLDDDWLALGGATLFSLSAGMLVYASLPLSDAPAVALLAATLYASSKAPWSGSRDAILLGLFGSLAVGCRPQLVVIVLPLLALTVLQNPSRGRNAVVVGAVFAAASLAWLLPLLAATGGPSGLLRYEFVQAADVAVNDASLARNGWRWSMLIQRFVAHPWGPKALSLPVLFCAGVGLAVAVVKRERRLAPLLVSGGLYLAFAVGVMDPSDGVRYALPAALVVALMACRGCAALASWRLRLDSRAVLVPVGLVGVGSLIYVWPVVGQRHAAPSPPAEAAAYARRQLPPASVILYEAPLRPHAQQLFSTFRSSLLEPGFGGLADRADTPVFVLADGASDEPGAVTFSWRDSDAYGKLTRNHYRVISLVPVPQARRFRAVRGVYRPERTVRGQSWRWLAPAAEIALPDVGARSAEIRLGLPADYPWGSVQVSVCAAPCATRVSASVTRGGTARVDVDLSAGQQAIRVESARSFVPAERPELLQRDRRVLGVMLLGVAQTSRASAFREPKSGRAASQSPMTCYTKRSRHARARSSGDRAPAS